MKTIKTKKPKVIKEPKVKPKIIPNGYIGITDWVKQYTHEFDTRGAAIGLKKRSNDTGTPVLGINNQVKYWKLNTERHRCYGKALHTFAEMYDIDNNTLTLTPKEVQVSEFLKRLYKGYTNIGNELYTYNDIYQIHGRIDKLVRNNNTGKYRIIDYKPSCDLDKTYNNMRKPFSKYPQSKRLLSEMQMLLYTLCGNIEVSKGSILQLTLDDFEPNTIIVIYDNTYELHIPQYDIKAIVIQELELRRNYENELKEVIC